jgi:hypothetical protein
MNPEIAYIYFFFLFFFFFFFGLLNTTSSVSFNDTLNGSFRFYRMQNPRLAPGAFPLPG